MRSRHDKLIEVMIEEYRNKGYEEIDVKLVGYKPDGMLQNDSEVVILEAVDTNDRGGLMLPREINGKSVRLDKRYCSYRRVTIKPDIIEVRNSKPDTIEKGTQDRKYCILIQEYRGYENGRYQYGNSRQLMVKTSLDLKELKSRVTKGLKNPQLKIMGG